MTGCWVHSHCRSIVGALVQELGGLVSEGGADAQGSRAGSLDGLAEEMRTPAYKVYIFRRSLLFIVLSSSPSCVFDT